MFSATEYLANKLIVGITIVFGNAWITVGLTLLNYIAGSGGIIHCIIAIFLIVCQGNIPRILYPLRMCEGFVLVCSCLSLEISDSTLYSIGIVLLFFFHIFYCMITYSKTPLI